MKYVCLFLVLASLAFSASGLQTSCLNDTYTYYSSNSTNITISNIYYQNAFNSIQGQFSLDYTYFFTKVLYSLTPFPNAVVFTCPQSRYKGLAFSTNDPYYYYGNYSVSISKFLYNSGDFYFNLYSIDTFNSSYYFPKNLTNYILVSIPDWKSSLPSDCSKIGAYDFTLNTTVTFPVISMSVNQSNYFTCSINSDDCGTLVTSKYNTSCCYINGIGTNATFTKKDNNFLLNPDGISCYLPFQWGLWQILVVAFSCLIIALLFIFLLSCICKVGGSFLSI